MRSSLSVEDSILKKTLLAAFRDYWNEHIRDREITTQPVGTPEFFQGLDAYRLDKPRYLPQVNEFDAVYAHGVLQYTANAEKMTLEIHRVLRPGGKAILMVYNEYSWANAMSKMTKVELEHEDGFAAVDIFRFDERGKIVEHWNVAQDYATNLPVLGYPRL